MRHVTDPDASPPQAAEDTFVLTDRQIKVAMSGLLLGMFLAALDQTIVSTALRTIANHLHGGADQAWVTTAYLVGGTVAVPFYGKLSDIYGRKPLYLAATGIFLLGSVASGCANSMAMLAVCRAAQGLGGAGLMSLPMAIIADMVPLRDRGRYMAHLTMTWVAASVIGPLAGGAFAGAHTLLGISGWRWAFLVNLPLGLLAVATVSKALTLPQRHRSHRLDYWGAAWIVVAVVPLLVVVEQGSAWGWASARAGVTYAVTAVGVALFVVREQRMGEEAMLPLKLFRRGGITVGALVNLTLGVSIFGTTVGLPLYLQLVRGKTPTQSGLLLIPFLLGTVASQMATGKIIKKTGRIKALAVVGVGSMASALLLFATMGVSTPMWEVGVLAVWIGLGTGISQTVIVLAIQNAVPKSELGVANGAGVLFRQLGGSLGTALFLSVMLGVAASRINSLVYGPRTSAFHRALAHAQAARTPGDRAFLDRVPTGGRGIDLNSTAFLAHMDPRLAQPVLEGFATGFRYMFFCGGIVLTLGFVLVWWIKELVHEDEPVPAAPTAEPAEQH